MSLLHPRWPRRGLYAITPDEPDTERLLTRVLPVLAAGAACLQYRNKAADDRLRLEQALALRHACADAGVTFVINDDWRLARRVDADGVHLGTDDGDIAGAREMLGRDMVIGASCYDDLDRARRAVEAGASYVAFGAFFPSLTKPHARRAALSLLHESRALGVPRVAIGGITRDNVAPLIEAGADLVAVIGGLWDAPEPAAAARALNSLFQDPSA